jgi:hypothetical protein
MRTHSARERQIDNDATSDVESLHSELCLSFCVCEGLKCLHNRARFPIKNGSCSYPGCESTNPGPCDRGIKKEDYSPSKIYSPSKKNGEPSTRTSERSEAHEISSSRALNEPTHITEAVLHQDPPRSLVRGQFDGHIDRVHKIGDAIVAAVRLVRSKAKAWSAHQGERQCGSASSRLDEADTPGPSPTIEEADTMPPAGDDPERTAGKDLIVSDFVSNFVEGHRLTRVGSRSDQEMSLFGCSKCLLCSYKSSSCLFSHQRSHCTYMTASSCFVLELYFSLSRSLLS